MNKQADSKRHRLRRANEFDELFGRANPNPDRVGCPPSDVLAALAKRERPIEDPGYDHLSECSPCYLEVRGLQEELALQRRNRFVAWGAAAALVLITAVLGWFFMSNQERGIPPSREVRTELDLRPYAVMRSESQPVAQKPLLLPRGRLLLTMLLPVGSEPGRYEVQILDRGLASRVSATGDAELRNQVTTLQATLELGSLAPGDYQLAIRRVGEDWQLFPAQLQ